MKSSAASREGSCQPSGGCRSAPRSRSPSACSAHPPRADDMIGTDRPIMSGDLRFRRLSDCTDLARVLRTGNLSFVGVPTMRLAVVRSLAVAAVCALWSAPALAIVQYANANRNTSAPTGTNLNSGWQWQGQWGGFLGTVISKKYFITADHFG